MGLGRNFHRFLPIFCPSRRFPIGSYSRASSYFSTDLSQPQCTSSLAERHNDYPLEISPHATSIQVEDVKRRNMLWRFCQCTGSREIYGKQVVLWLCCFSSYCCGGP